MMNHLNDERLALIRDAFDSSSPIVRRRAEVLILLYAEVKPRRVARIVGVHPSTVYRWRRSWLNGNSSLLLTDHIAPVSVNAPPLPAPAPVVPQVAPAVAVPAPETTSITVAIWHTIRDKHHYAIIGLFIAAVLYAFFGALSIHRSYQDGWLLDGITVHMGLLFCAYALVITRHISLKWTTIATALFVAMIYIVPGIKYAEVYLPTLDTAVHFSMMRSLAETGRPDNTIYQYTPGMHLLVAALAQISGLSAEMWAKLLPGLAAGTVPLGIYTVTRRGRIPEVVRGPAVVLSGLSLPLLYMLEGTGFAIIVIAAILNLVALWVVATGQDQIRRGYILLALLLLVSLAIWHAISSILIPLVIGVVGVVYVGGYTLAGLVRESRWFRSIDSPAVQSRVMVVTMPRENRWLRSTGVYFLYVGFIVAILILGYWYFIASEIWEQLNVNAEVFQESMLNRLLDYEIESQAQLIPRRTFTLTTNEMLLMGATYHARDGVVLGLAFIPVLGIIIAIMRAIRHGYPPRLIFLYLSLAAAFLSIIVGVFLSGFAKQGYLRFVSYLVMVTPILAAYGLWTISRLLRRLLPIVPQRFILTTGLILAYAISAAQIYPYQPAFPTLPEDSTHDATPVLWLHRVNTQYQRQLIEFAYHRLPEDAVRYTNYNTYQQAKLFLGTEAAVNFHYGYWNRPRSTYVLAHIPGLAGGYGEPAETRTREVVLQRRELDRVSTIYDNGESFILYVPEELIPVFDLEAIIR